MADAIKRGDTVILLVSDGVTFTRSPFADEPLGLVSHVVGTTAWVYWPNNSKTTPHDVATLQRIDVTSS